MSQPLKKVVKKLDKMVVNVENIDPPNIEKSLKKIIKKISNLNIEKKVTKCVRKDIPKTNKKIIKKKVVMKYLKKGQIKPTPPETDPLRKFYTSLLYQKPDSEMALKWCIEHGLGPNE